MPLKKAMASVGGAITTLALTFAALTPPLATAQPIPPAPATLPGTPSLPDLPGMPSTAGGVEQLATQAVASDPMAQRVLNHNVEGATAPASEESTNPRCAPLLMVAVPGTFEIDRSADPNEPVGLLASLAGPLREQLGAGFSETYVNYDSDAGISGTAYAQSVAHGTQKTLSTIQDVQDRCAGSRVLLAGFSQGADIAGDVATLIGNGQTAIHESTMAGVVLFADPKRDENANVLVGTSQAVPDLPAVVGDAVEGLMKDPSLAQLQMKAGDLSGIASQLLGSDSEGSTAPIEAGAVSREEDEKESAKAAPEPEVDAAGVASQGFATGGFDAAKFDAASNNLTIVAQPQQEIDGAAEGDAALDDTAEKEADAAYSYASEEDVARAAATGVIVPGTLGPAPRPAVYRELTDEEKEGVKLGVGQVWATPENLEVYDEFQAAYTEQTGEQSPGIMGAEAERAVESVRSLIDLQKQVGRVYRAGVCEELTFEDCVSLFSGTAGIVALALQVETLPEESPAKLATLPEGNLIETQCATMTATACAATPTAEEPTLPPATMVQVSNDTASAVEEPAVEEQETGSEDSSPSTTPESDNSAGPGTSVVEQPQAGEATADTSAPAFAGAQERPTEPVPASASKEAAAGEESRPTDEITTTTRATSTEPSTAAPEAGEESRPTEEAYTGTLGGATTGERPEGDGAADAEVNEAVEGVDPISMAAVAGGGVAGQREQGFGTLTGSVVSLCVPGDIVCSLPENSALARDLVQVGQNVSTNLSGVAREAMAGNTRMGGLLAVEAVNTVARVSGLPPLKLSAATIEMLIQMVAGGAMIAAGDPTGAGVALILGAMHQMPAALPELYAQLQDIPVIIEQLPSAADTAARNLGLSDLSNRLGAGFEQAGLTDITDAANLPDAAVTAATGLLESNSGLMELATNPDYLTTGAHSEQGFRSIMVSEDAESIEWTQDWMMAVSEMIDAA